MHDPDNHKSGGIPQPLKSSLLMLSFGLMILAYLVAIDRPEWFHIRPVTGTAAAMSHAASPPAPSGLPVT